MNNWSWQQRQENKRNSRIFYSTHCSECKSELEENEHKMCDSCKREYDTFERVLAELSGKLRNKSDVMVSKLCDHLREEYGLSGREKLYPKTLTSTEEQECFLKMFIMQMDK